MMTDLEQNTERRELGPSDEIPRAAARILAGVGRELMRTISGFRETMERLETEEKPSVERIMVELSRQLMELESIGKKLGRLTQLGKPQPRRGRMDEVFRRMQRGLEDRAEEAGCSLAVRLETSQCEVLVDEAQLENALQQLVDNAVLALEDFNGDRTIELRVSEQDRRGRCFIEIEVSDSGPGVHPDLEESLFEPFASGWTRRRSGLGLALVQRIVTEHGGRVWLQPSSKGASFRIHLPCLAESEKSLSTPTPWKTTNRREKGRICIFSEPGQLDFMATRLKTAGYDVLVFSKWTPLGKQLEMGLVNLVLVRTSSTMEPSAEEIQERLTEHRVPSIWLLSAAQASMAEQLERQGSDLLREPYFFSSLEQRIKTLLALKDTIRVGGEDGDQV